MNSIRRQEEEIQADKGHHQNRERMTSARKQEVEIHGDERRQQIGNQMEAL